MWQYNQMPEPDELMHYGVLGMKWGKRRYQNKDGSLTPAGKARQEYKESKSNLKTANKEVRRTGGGFGIEGIAKYNDASQKRNDAYADTVSAKAKYKASKAKDPDKAEFNSYVKAMTKGGLPGSAKDRAMNNQSTIIYDRVVAEKGRDYADKVAKKTQNKLVSTLVASSAVVVGAAAVDMVLLMKR